MAEPFEAETVVSAGGGKLEPKEDEEELEPLLPRVAWAPPRKGTPGNAVRLVDPAGKHDAASLGDSGDLDLLLPPPPAPCLRSPRSALGLQRPRRSHVSGARRRVPPRRPCRFLFPPYPVPWKGDSRPSTPGGAVGRGPRGWPHSGGLYLLLPPGIPPRSCFRWSLTRIPGAPASGASPKLL